VKTEQRRVERKGKRRHVRRREKTGLRREEKNMMMMLLPEEGLKLSIIVCQSYIRKRRRSQL